MVSAESVEKQLKKVNFNLHGWGRTEARELPRILMPEEELHEVVNGIYEGGFALLVATNFRIMLIDKKPMNYLTVEDLRFDMISEIDYAHRLIAARISISTGSKNLKFTSLNQQRLRKLITHVQHGMAESKKKSDDHQEDQKQHLEQINQQLQTFLLAQYQEQQALRNSAANNNSTGAVARTPLKPPQQLADYLYAQSLLSQNQATRDRADTQTLQLASGALADYPPSLVHEAPSQSVDKELYDQGRQEIFGNRQPAAASYPSQTAQQPVAQGGGLLSFEINPLKVAYSKLPMALRNRKFGRPSFHDHSESGSARPPQPVTATQ
jgi:hypothetical protein